MELETENQAPRKWYVIHTYSGYENKVKTNLEHRIESMGVQDKIFQVVVPDRGGDRDQGWPAADVEEGLPGLRPGRDGHGRRFLVRRAQHARRDRLRRLRQPAATAAGRRSQADPEADRDEAPQVKVSLHEGRERRGLSDGPFTDFIGVVDDINPDEKVKVLVSFFGRETPVELDFLQVEKI